MASGFNPDAKGLISISIGNNAARIIAKPNS